MIRNRIDDLTGSVGPPPADDIGTQLRRNFLFLGGNKAFVWSPPKRECFLSSLGFRDESDLICSKGPELDLEYLVRHQSRLLFAVTNLLEKVKSALEAWEEQSERPDIPLPQRRKSFGKLLKRNVDRLKQVEYGVGLYNSFLEAFMVIIDRSLFGLSVFRNRSQSIKVQSWPSGAPALDSLRKMQTGLSEEPVCKLNGQISEIEARLRMYVPDFREMKSQFERKDNRTSILDLSAPPALARLRTYEPPSGARLAGLSKLTVRQMRFGYCSDLVFVLTGENHLVVYDVFQDAVCQRLENWPFAICGFLVRRNLNFYVSDALLEHSVADFEDMMARRNFASSVLVDGASVCALELLEFASTAKGYFAAFNRTHIFHKPSLRDEYVLVLQMGGRGQLFYIVFAHHGRQIEQTRRRAKTLNLCESMADVGESARKLARSQSIFFSFRRANSFSG